VIGPASALETTRGLLHHFKISWTYGPQMTYNWTIILPTLHKFCILLHCQALHTESKQKSTKLCDMLGSEPDLQMHVKIWGVPSPKKDWELKTVYFVTVLISTKLLQMVKIEQEFLPTFRKRSSWLWCQRNMVAPHNECKCNHWN